MERGFYSDQIKQIQSTFNNDQLLLLQNESLRNDPNKVLGKVAKFLSISSFETVEHVEIHTRSYPIELSNDEFDFLHIFYKDEILKLESLLGWDLSEWKDKNE